MVVQRPVFAIARVFVDSEYCEGVRCHVSQATVHVTLYQDGCWEMTLHRPDEVKRHALFAGKAGAEQRFIIGFLRATSEIGALSRI